MVKLRWVFGFVGADFIACPAGNFELNFAAFDYPKHTHRVNILAELTHG